MTPLYVVGPATHRALLSSPFIDAASVYGAETGNGESLARFIQAHYNALYAPAQDRSRQRQKLPILFLVGEQRRDVIPRMLMRDETLSEQDRIVVEEWVVYEAKVSSSLRRDLEWALEEVFAPGPAGAGVGAVEEGKARDGHGDSEELVKGHETSRVDMCWIVVFSPTGCEELLGDLGHVPPSLSQSPPSPSSTTSYRTSNNPAITWSTTIKNGPERSKTQEKRIYIATIGPTTRDHLRRSLGFEPHVCAQSPTPQGVGEGIRAFMCRD